ncbi:four helix bundle protein [Mesotoga sp. UBA6090]
MSNIAEGAGKKHKKDFDLFLYLARGSLNETVVQLGISF